MFTIVCKRTNEREKGKERSKLDFVLCLICSEKYEAIKRRKLEITIAAERKAGGNNFAPFSPLHCCLWREEKL